MLQLTNAVERYKQLILNELKEADVNCWIAGGALRDYFSGVKMNTDYDLFFPNEIEFEKAKKYFDKNGCVVKWESDNGMKVVYKGKTYDLVKKFFATPKETIDAFDFTVSMFAVDTENVYYGETTFIDLAKRQLMINKITYPASTMSRAFRYYKKGFTMCLGEMKKLIEAIQDMPKAEAIENINNSGNDDKKSSGDNLLFFTGID
jgi:hypothetical protein